MKIKLISLLSLCLMNGCATVRYVEPTSGNTAKVRFASPNKKLVVVRSYGNINCDNEKEMMRLRNGFLLNSEPRSLGMPTFDKLSRNAYKEFLIPSNKEHIFMFYGETPYIICGVPIKTSFMKNKSYEIMFKNTKRACEAKLSEIVISNGQPKKNLIKTYKNSISGYTSGCMKKFKQSRLY